VINTKVSCVLSLMPEISFSSEFIGLKL